MLQEWKKNVYAQSKEAKARTAELQQRQGWDSENRRMIDHSECIRVGYLDPEISDIFAVKQNCLSIPYLLFV